VCRLYFGEGMSALGAKAPQSGIPFCLRARGGKMILSYQGKQYFGENILAVFRKLWHSKEKMAIFSKDEQEFIANMFEAMAIHILVRKAAIIINLQSRQNRDWTEEEKKVIDNSIDEVYHFIDVLRDRKLLHPKFLFAYGQIT